MNATLKVLGMLLVAAFSTNNLQAKDSQFQHTPPSEISVKGDIMYVKILSTDGDVVYQGNTTKKQAKKLDFDLSSYPEGTYTVEIYYAEKLINRTKMFNESKAMSMVIRDKKGNKVHYDLQKSVSDDKMNFDLSKFPKGQYTIEIYRGINKLNSIELEN